LEQPPSSSFDILENSSRHRTRETICDRIRVPLPARPPAPQLAYPQSRGVGQEYEINENLQASISMHYSGNTHCRFHLTSTKSCELVKANEQTKKLGSEKAINEDRKKRREGKNLITTAR
jgi:hypothetical protein